MTSITPLVSVQPESEPEWFGSKVQTLLKSSRIVFAALSPSGTRRNSIFSFEPDKNYGIIFHANVKNIFRNQIRSSCCVRIIELETFSNIILPVSLNVYIESS